MSPPLPVLSGAETVKALELAGYEFAGQRGSHLKLRRAQQTVVVPLHRELASGTLRSIIRQAGLSVEEFIELAKR